MYVAKIYKILWQLWEYVYPEKDPWLHFFIKPYFWTGTTGSGVDLYFFLLKLNRFNKSIINAWQNAASEAIIITPISNWGVQCLNV